MIVLLVFPFYTQHFLSMHRCGPSFFFSLFVELQASDARVMSLLNKEIVHISVRMAGCCSLYVLLYLPNTLHPIPILLLLSYLE